MAFAFPGGHLLLDSCHQPAVNGGGNLLSDLALVNLYCFLARVEHHPAVGALRHVTFEFFLGGGVGGVV